MQNVVEDDGAGAPPAKAACRSSIGRGRAEEKRVAASASSSRAVRGTVGDGAGRRAGMREEQEFQRIAERRFAPEVCVVCSGRSWQAKIENCDGALGSVTKMLEGLMFTMNDAFIVGGVESGGKLDADVRWCRGIGRGAEGNRLSRVWHSSNSMAMKVRPSRSAIGVESCKCRDALSAGGGAGFTEESFERLGIAGASPLEEIESGRRRPKFAVFA